MSHGGPGGGTGGPGVQANNTGVPPDQKVNKAEGLTYLSITIRIEGTLHWAGKACQEQVAKFISYETN